mmetsp:Transcript_50687/g.91263  ORF Transcript_50687/g.91263 Transcript_50687/m.91263 type:complete len:527 (-) Transcript_50687:847-2427(-)
MHGVTPELVDGLEVLCFARHLANNVLRAEDGLKVQPCPLASEPLLQEVLDVRQLGFPVLHFLLNWLHEGRSTDCLCLDDVVIEQRLDIVGALQQEGAAVLVSKSAKLHGLPLVLHGGEGYLQAVLLLRRCTDGLDRLHVIENIDLQQHGQRQAILKVDVHIHGLEELQEVIQVDGRLAQPLDDRHVLLEGRDSCPHLLGHLLRGRHALKALEHLVGLLEAVVHVGLHFTGVELAQLSREPLLLVPIVVNGRGPQLEVGLVLILENLHLGVVHQVHAEELLPVRVGLGPDQRSLQVVLQSLDLLRHFPGRGVGVEFLDLVQNLSVLRHVLPELGLLLFQLCHESDLLLLELTIRLHQSHLDHEGPGIGVERLLDNFGPDVVVEVLHHVQRIVHCPSPDHQGQHHFLLNHCHEFPELCHLPFILWTRHDVLVGRLPLLKDGIRPLFDGLGHDSEAGLRQGFRCAGQLGDHRRAAETEQWEVHDAGCENLHLVLGPPVGGDACAGRVYVQGVEICHLLGQKVGVLLELL